MDDVNKIAMNFSHVQTIVTYNNYKNNSKKSIEGKYK